MRHLQKVAVKFIKHDLRGRADLRALIKFLQKTGYTVIFFSDTENIELLSRLDLLEYSKGKNAFTVQSKNLKAVFLRKDCSEHERLCSIAHETAHIKLGHLNKEDIERNTRCEEMEAEAFAYAVLNYKHSVAVPFSLIAFTVICLGTLWLSTHNPPQGTSTVFQEEEIVYITPSGHKYHRGTCFYTKDKDCTALTLSEARKTHTPCKVCIP